MSLDKAIQHNKEHRKKYRGSKSIDSTCRNHGSCDWCRENRQINSLKNLEKTDEMIKEYKNETDIT